MARKIKSDSPVDCRATPVSTASLPYEVSRGHRGNEPRHPHVRPPTHIKPCMFDPHSRKACLMSGETVKNIPVIANQSAYMMRRSPNAKGQLRFLGRKCCAFSGDCHASVRNGSQ